VIDEILLTLNAYIAFQLWSTCSQPVDGFLFIANAVCVAIGLMDVAKKKFNNKLETK
jgi:hypothetical protein